MHVIAKEMATVMIVGLRKLWLERNSRVFEGKGARVVARVVVLAKEEHKQDAMIKGTFIALDHRGVYLLLTPHLAGAELKRNETNAA